MEVTHYIIQAMRPKKLTTAIIVLSEIEHLIFNITLPIILYVIKPKV